jgi:hypothetical protein
MKRPEVTLENYQAVYEFYDQYEPSARAQRAAHLILNLMYHPHVAFADDTDIQLEQAAENDMRLLIVANHVRGQDPLLFGPALRARDSLKYYNGRTIEPAKASIYKMPIPGLRYGLDILGAVPAFRKQETAGATLDVRFGATAGYSQVSINKVIGGRSMIIHAEGTRNRDNPRELLPIKEGTGRLACTLSKKVDIGILPVAIWYKGHTKIVSGIAPNMYFGNLMAGPFDDHKKVTQDVAINLQNCLNHAAAMSD